MATRLLVTSICLLVASVRACSTDIYAGCGCKDRFLTCNSSYTGSTVPSFSKADNLHNLARVMMTNMNIKTMQAFVLLNAPASLIMIYGRIETIDAKAFWSSETNSTTVHSKLSALFLGYNNSIRHIAGGTFDPLISLTHLDLDMNRITHFDRTAFVNVPKLKSLELSQNGLTTLPDRWIPKKLTMLSLYVNPLKRLTSANFAGDIILYQLGVSLRNVSVDDDAFSALTNLKDIRVNDPVDCSCAHTWYLNAVSDNAVCYNRNTGYPDIRAFLNGECVPPVPGEITCPADTVEGCQCIKQNIVCGDGYKGEDIPYFTKTATIYNWIVFSKTSIKRINEFLLLNTKTKKLNLSGNKLKTIDVKAFWTNQTNNKTIHNDLIYLNLADNKIENIEIGTFDPLNNLKSLYLNNNRISNIKSYLIVNLNKLNYVSMASNDLKNLPTKWIPKNLKTLDIRGNKIKSLSRDVFKGASKLNKLHMSADNIQIEYDTFIDTNALKVINVSPKKKCTCDYNWYLNTKSESKVCNMRKNKYGSIRKYLIAECKESIPDKREKLSIELLKRIDILSKRIWNNTIEIHRLNSLHQIT